MVKGVEPVYDIFTTTRVCEEKRIKADTAVGNTSTVGSTENPEPETVDEGISK